MTAPASAARRALRCSSGRRIPSRRHTTGRTCTQTSRWPRPPPAQHRSARTRCASRGPSALLPLTDVENGEKRFLRHLDGADLLHPLLPRLLLLEQLSLAGDVTPVALRKHVLPLRL